MSEVGGGGILSIVYRVFAKQGGVERPVSLGPRPSPRRGERHMPRLIYNKKNLQKTLSVSGPSLTPTKLCSF